MTVCRYFLQGYCRFGETCRFEHADPYSYREGSNRRNDHNTYDNRSSYYATPDRRNEYDNKSFHNDGPNRRNYNYYDDRTWNQEQGNYNQNRNNQYNQRYYTPENNQYQTHEKYDRSNNQFRGRGGSETYDHGSKYDKSKHEWVSEDYKRQIEQKNTSGAFYNTSTPKSKTTFSFRNQEPREEKDHSIDLHMNEKNLAYAEMIREDVIAWEKGCQWPFSCYSPIQDRSSFPGFIDLSPEELRFEAYKARESNTYNSYVESVKKAVLDVRNKRNLLKEPSVQLMSVIEKLRTGQDLSAESNAAGDLPFSNVNQSLVEEMVADGSSQIQNNTVAAFSFKTTLETDSLPKSNTSSFSFKLPAGTELKPISQDESSDIYTSLDKISSQDKEQFSASTFTLGKIPIVPPPRILCF